MLLLSFETRELAVSDRKTSPFGFCRAEAIRVSGAVRGSYYRVFFLLVPPKKVLSMELVPPNRKK